MSNAATIHPFDIGRAYAAMRALAIKLDARAAVADVGRARLQRRAADAWREVAALAIKLGARPTGD